MSNLSLNELLDSVGINKKILAKLMDVSRSTVMRMKDEVSPEVLAAIDKYKQAMTPEQSESVPVPETVAIPVHNTDEQSASGVLPVTHRNIALSRMLYGDGMSIDIVARQFGLSVFKYNQAVDDTVAYCMSNDVTFQELREL